MTLTAFKGNLPERSGSKLSNVSKINVTRLASIFETNQKCINVATNNSRTTHIFMVYKKINKFMCQFMNTIKLFEGANIDGNLTTWHYKFRVEN
jgi:hypothetical protein